MLSPSVINKKLARDFQIRCPSSREHRLGVRLARDVQTHVFFLYRA
jgi:hypothetical protein